MAEYRLFDPADPPEWLDPTWWADGESCNHLAHIFGVHNARLQAVADLVTEVHGMAHPDGAPWITDIGAGDGALLSLLPLPVRKHAVGAEIVKASVAYARDVRGVDVREANVMIDDVPWGGPTTLVVCTEVLEHQADPHAFVRDVLAGCDWLIASSPHVENDINHEWNHAWAWDHDGYRALIEQGGFDVVRHFSVEWSQIILAKRRCTDVAESALRLTA